MRVLIDMSHPADVHFFRPIIMRLHQAGHTTKLTAREKDVITDLTRDFEMDVEVFGGAPAGLGAMGVLMVKRCLRLRRIIRQFKPDVALAYNAGPFVCPPAWWAGVPSYIFYDTEHAIWQNRLSYPLATCVFVPRAYRDELRCTHERYAGYNELAYLRPPYFEPDFTGLRALGLRPDEPYTVVRFVNWKAAHDVGMRGFSDDEKLEVAERLGRFGRVLISSEGPLPIAIEPLRLTIHGALVHQLIYHARLVFGESSTMASEAACLGVPSVFVDGVGRGYTDEQESRYHLVHNFRQDARTAAIDRGEAILNEGDARKWRGLGQALIDDTIDVADLVLDVVARRPHAGMPDAPING